MSYPAYWRPSLREIFGHLENGDYDAAATLLFDTKVQKENERSLEFWYAQILVASLQNMGFHITFLTAAATYVSYSRDAFLKHKDEMLRFFEQYADRPEYKLQRDQILRLIAFYKNS